MSSNGNGVTRRDVLIGAASGLAYVAIELGASALGCKRADWFQASRVRGQGRLGRGRAPILGSPAC